MHPRPLTKPQRELLTKCRGDGLRRSDFAPHEERLLDGLYRQRWIAYRHVAGDGAYFYTARAGEAKLVELAPPPPEGRLACVNPRCWRTFAREKNPGITSIVCGTCWRSVPEIRRERKELDALRRRELRAGRRRGEDKTTKALWLIDRRIDANWQRMIAFFTAPEKPEGLAKFLKEMDWHEELGEPDDEARQEDESAP